jgi:hypothetical protein
MSRRPPSRTSRPAARWTMPRSRGSGWRAGRRATARRAFGPSSASAAWIRLTSMRLSPPPVTWSWRRPGGWPSGDCPCSDGPVQTAPRPAFEISCSAAGTRRRSCRWSSAKRSASGTMNEERNRARTSGPRCQCHRPSRWALVAAEPDCEDAEPARCGRRPGTARATSPEGAAPSPDRVETNPDRAETNPDRAAPTPAAAATSPDPAGDTMSRA